jgi:hypothetical protein
MQNQLPQAIARFAAERRGGVEAAADLRRVDAEQPHAADRRHVDRVAVDDRAHHHQIGAGSKSARRRCLNGCNSRNDRSDENLHSRLRAQWVARMLEARCKLLTTGAKDTKETKDTKDGRRSSLRVVFCGLCGLCV